MEGLFQAQNISLYSPSDDCFRVSHKYALTHRLELAFSALNQRNILLPLPTWIFQTMFLKEIVITLTFVAGNSSEKER